jgi:hypothetical protein
MLHIPSVQATPLTCLVQVCCTDTGYHCEAGTYCSPVYGYCCDNVSQAVLNSSQSLIPHIKGEDINVCAARQGFTVPATTASSTPAPVPATTSAPAETMPATTSVPAPATYTGAAVRLDAGWAGKALAVALGLGGIL